VLPALGLALAFLGANLCLQYGAARLSATVTAVVMPCEVLFAALTAVWWGGATLHDFAFAILVGIIVGTYSSIFIASPIVLWSSRRSGFDLKKDLKKKGESPAVQA